MTLILSLRECYAVQLSRHEPISSGWQQLCHVLIDVIWCFTYIRSIHICRPIMHWLTYCRPTSRYAYNEILSELYKCKLTVICKVMNASRTIYTEHSRIFAYDITSTSISNVGYTKMAGVMITCFADHVIKRRLTQVAGQLADKPNRGQLNRGLVNSRTGQVAD